MKKGLLVAL